MPGGGAKSAVGLPDLSPRDRERYQCVRLDDEHLLYMDVVSFLGSHTTDDRLARGVAEGLVDPVTMQPFNLPENISRSLIAPPVKPQHKSKASPVKKQAMGVTIVSRPSGNYPTSSSNSHRSSDVPSSGAHVANTRPIPLSYSLSQSSARSSGLSQDEPTSSVPLTTEAEPQVTVIVDSDDEDGGDHAVSPSQGAVVAETRTTSSAWGEIAVTRLPSSSTSSSMKKAHSSSAPSSSSSRKSTEKAAPGHATLTSFYSKASSSSTAALPPSFDWASRTPLPTNNTRVKGGMSGGSKVKSSSLLVKNGMSTTGQRHQRVLSGGGSGLKGKSGVLSQSLFKQYLAKPEGESEATKHVIRLDSDDEEGTSDVQEGKENSRTHNIAHKTPVSATSSGRTTLDPSVSYHSYSWHIFTSHP